MHFPVPFFFLLVCLCCSLTRPRFGSLLYIATLTINGLALHEHRRHGLHSVAGAAEKAFGGAVPLQPVAAAATAVPVSGYPAGTYVVNTADPSQQVAYVQATAVDPATGATYYVPQQQQQQVVAADAAGQPQVYYAAPAAGAGAPAMSMDPAGHPGQPQA